MTIREQQKILYDSIQQARGGIGVLPMKNNSTLKGRYFAVILYEDCIEHMEMLKYITSRPRYEYVYIFHDKDIWTASDTEVIDGLFNDGDLKKPHYHLLYKTLNSSSVQSQHNFFSTWVNHVELVSDWASYISYMIHDTPNSFHKHHYEASALQGTTKLIKSALGSEAIIQNRNLVEMCNSLTNSDGSLINLISDMSELPVSEVADYMDTLARFQGLISEISRQEISRKLRKE